MDVLQIIDRLSEPDTLPVEAIRAAQADRASVVPIFDRLSTLETFRPRLQANEKRSSPNRAGSTPTIKGP